MSSPSPMTNSLSSTHPSPKTPTTPKTPSPPPMMTSRDVSTVSSHHSSSGCRRSWHKTILSPSPSPKRSPTLRTADPEHQQQHVLYTKRSISTPAVPSPIMPEKLSLESSSRRSSVPPLATYRSPTAAPSRPLPRLNTSGEFILHSPPPPKNRLPTLYQREFYPTPITVTERMRWPAPHAAAEACTGRAAPYLPYPTLNGYASSEAPLPTQGATGTTGEPAYTPPRLYGPAPTYLNRPRLSIHPYAVPPDPRFYAAGAIPHAPPIMQPDRYASPASSIGGGSPGGFKAPRKRADDIQLNVLNEVFDRTQYPSTEERDDLARRLGMTSRSVQIWFQNRRRAVKVEQQSAVQRAEADARMVEARAWGLPGPPYLHEGFPPVKQEGEMRSVTPMTMGVGQAVKREIASPEGGIRNGVH